MQVNVKELTGVLHLKLVFMNVLVLQSFLAVSFQVQVSQVFLSFQVFVSSQVLAPCVAESFQVFQVVKLYFFKAPSA